MKNKLLLLIVSILVLTGCSIGNANGKNVDADTMELTRELAKNKALFETDKNAETNKTKYASQYEYYLKLKKEYENELAEAKQYQAQFTSIYENFLMG